MLFYNIIRCFGCASIVAKITLARTFINNRTLLVGTNAILLNGRKSSPSIVNFTRIDCNEIFFNGLSNLTSKLQENATNPI